MFKFLAPDGCTYYGGKPFAYNLPRRGEKWALTEHPNPAEPDGEQCGAGRLHLMNGLDAQYAPVNWWVWWARGVGEQIGGDEEKTAFAAVELRRITRDVFWRALRLGWGRRADLRGADLRGADLRGADLSNATLRGADLSRAIMLNGERHE